MTERFQGRKTDVVYDRKGCMVDRNSGSDVVGRIRSLKSPSATLCLFLGASACASDAPNADLAAQAGDAARSSAVQASPYAASASDQTEILATLQRLFDALGSGDGDALRALLDPEIQMHSVEQDADGTPSVGTSTLEQLVARVEAEGPPLIERMFDPEVRISGDLATIWTPYDFYIGSELSHCGADAVTLKREAGVWTIIGLNWTRLQPPACPLHPDGPPH